MTLEDRWKKQGLIPLEECEDKQVVEDALAALRLYMAIVNEDEEEFFDAIDSVPHFNWECAIQFRLNTNCVWESPLSAVGTQGTERMLRELLERGADPSMMDELLYPTGHRETVLHHAAEHDSDRLKILLESGKCLIDQADESGHTALYRAVSKGLLNSVRLLLKYGADPKKPFFSNDYLGITGPLDTMFPSPLTEWNALLLAANGHHPEVVALLLEKHFSNGIDMTTSSGVSALHYAIRHCSEKKKDDRWQTLCLLLNHGADPNAREACSLRTPVHVLLSAAEAYHIRIQDHWHLITVDTLRLLTSHGADLNSQDLCGKTPHHLASVLGQDIVVNELLTNGGEACVTSRDRDGNTPLHLAALHGNYERFLLLEQKASDLGQHINHWGETLLHAAVLGVQVRKRGARNILKHLSGKISWEAMDKQGRSARHFARHLGIWDDANNSVVEEAEGTPVDKENVENIFQAIRKCPGYQPEVDDGGTGEWDSGLCSEYLLRLFNCKRIGAIHADPESCGHERCLIAKQVGEVVDSLLKTAEMVDPRLAGEILQTGSAYEGFRMESPDEFDLMFLLRELSEPGAVRIIKSDEPGFVFVEISERLQERYRDLVTENGHLHALKLKEHMVRLVWQATDPEKWASPSPFIHAKCNRYHLECAVCKPLVDYTAPGIQLRLIWMGEEYMWLPIDVDVVPCLRLEGWPEDAVKVPNIDCTCYHLVPKAEFSDPLLWRISFSTQEKEILQGLPEIPSACYGVLKILKEIYGAGKTLHTYVMKSLLFQARDEFPEESAWAPDLLAQRVMDILKKMLFMVTQENESISSFFLPKYHVTSDARMKAKQSLTVALFKFGGSQMLSDLENLGKGNHHWLSSAREQEKEKQIEESHESNSLADKFPDMLIAVKISGFQLVVGTLLTQEEEEAEMYDENST